MNMVTQKNIPCLSQNLKRQTGVCQFLSSNAPMIVVLRRHMPYRAMLFKCMFVGFHMMRRGMPYRMPRPGDRASGMHGRSVHAVPRVHLFVMVLMSLIPGRFIMTVHGTFDLLLRLRQTHAAIGGLADSR